MCSVKFFEICAIYEKIWKNTVEQGRPQVTIWHMHIECWIPKATNTHSGWVILIVFPQQQWLHECTSMLCYTYTACLVTYLYAHFFQVQIKRLIQFLNCKHIFPHMYCQVFPFMSNNWYLSSQLHERWDGISNGRGGKWCTMESSHSHGIMAVLLTEPSGIW